MAPLDELLFAQALEAQAAQAHALAQAELARVRFQDSLRELHRSGASMREMAKAFGLSHQRVHQLVGCANAGCSFCGTPRARAKSLVAGPGVWICDGCVDLATGVVAGEASALRRWATLEAPPARRSAKWRSREQCSFCGKKPDQVAGLAEGGTRRICTECLALCRQIVADEARS